MSTTEKKVLEIGRDILITVVILMIVLASLYVFSGRWPPMVVIETGSMMHSENSQIGTIDPGDIVLVQETNRDEITTYVEGRDEDYRMYGQYGDVIIFEPDGKERETPIIHRAVLYLEENDTSFDIPALSALEYNEDWNIQNQEEERVEDGMGLNGTIEIYDYGIEDKDLTIELKEYDSSGYITKGDNNLDIDQNEGGTITEPVKEEWILGRARGELPWFGIIRLGFMSSTEEVPSNSWRNFTISIAAILLIPVLIELSGIIYDRWDQSEEKEPQQENKMEDHQDNIVEEKNR